MRKILIVDDEELIRNGLKVMVERYKEDYYDITTCHDGISAKEQIKENYFDIIITDIRMPNLTGIELIKDIRNKGLNTSIVIVSGYDSFNYASEALKCGAKAYLLKPIKRNELYDTLESIEEDIELKNTTNVEKINYILFNEKISSKDINKILNNIRQEFLYDKFTCFVTRMKNKDSKEKLYSYINDDKTILFNDYKGNLVIFSNSEKEVKKIIKDSNELSDLSIGMSSEGKGIDDIRKSYEEALRSYEYRVFYEEKHIINYSELEIKSRKNTIDENFLENIKNSIGLDRIEDINNTLNSIVDVNNLSQYDLQYILEFNRNIVGTIRDISERINIEDNLLKENINKLSSIYNFENINIFIRRLKEVLYELNGELLVINSKSSSNNALIKAVDYINNNFNKQINLAVVANYVSMNYTYFSEMFKEYTGDSFVNYLKKIRVEEAKKLLTNPEYKIYQIATEVGYDDPKHFSKIFKKITGVTPNEYRNNVLNN
jgi:two-component system response regulator YesN